MQYVNLGKSGLKVSRLCLGMMSYGDKKWRPWVLEEPEALPFVQRALEAGINFFDTADIYSRGAERGCPGEHPPAERRAPRAGGHRHQALQRDER